jgi:hypothetical protein
MKKLLAPLFLLLTALWLGGCTNIAEVSTSGLQADLVRLQRTANGEVRVTWRVRNPNIVAYVLTKTSFRLSLDGAPVGLMTDTTRVGVPSMNLVEQTAVLVPSGPAAADIISRAIAKGSANYSFEATLWMLVVDDKSEKFSLTASGTIPATAE